MMKFDLIKSEHKMKHRNDNDLIKPIYMFQV